MKVAVITGASSGIGRATAHEFASHGSAVVVLSRRLDRLQSLKSEIEAETQNAVVLPLACDVTKWSDVEAAAKKIADRFPAVSTLVNNAGAYEYQTLENTTAERLDHLIDVNVRGVVYMTKALLPLLKAAAKESPPVKVVNVSSIGGLWGFSNMSVYTATKFAVTGFSSALRRELRADGIDVASIHPGPVDNAETPKARRGRSLVMLPPQIAKQIYSLAASKRRRHISHPAFSLLNLLEAVSPEMVDRVLKRIL